jgi:hypothetical protein
MLPMSPDIPKYISRQFKCLPVKNGKAIIDDVISSISGFPKVLFKASNDCDELNIRANQLTLKTDQPIADGIAELKVGVFRFINSGTVKYGGGKLFGGKEFADGKNWAGPKASCHLAFSHSYDCFPPFDDLPLCQNPQPFSGFTDASNNPTGLDGAWFVVTGYLESQGAAYPDDEIISGLIALLFETSAS